METLERRLLRLPEAAEALGVSIGSIYKLIRVGLLRPVTLPGLRGPRIDRVDLVALIQNAKEPVREITPR